VGLYDLLPYSVCYQAFTCFLGINLSADYCTTSHGKLTFVFYVIITSTRITSQERCPVVILVLSWASTYPGYTCIIPCMCRGPCTCISYIRLIRREFIINSVPQAIRCDTGNTFPKNALWECTTQLT